jgi:hypothetical protein
MQSGLLTFKFKDERLPTISLSHESVAMPITQLQIPIPSGLKSTDSVRDALERLQASGYCDNLEFDTVRHLAQASAADGTVNWFKYWESREFCFEHLRLKCDELDRLALAHPLHAVDKKSFGKAGITLWKNGVKTFTLLVERLEKGLSPVNGFGKTKTVELFSYLVSYIKRNERGESIFLVGDASGSRSSKANDGGNVIHHASLNRLSSAARALPLRIIHLEKKSKAFEKAGLGTLGDLANASMRGIPKIRGIGPETIKMAEFVLSAISASVDEAGEVDWAAFAAHAKIPTIPADMSILSGKEFIELLPSVCAELITATHDNVERDIFLTRLTRKRTEQKTLEQLGSQIGVTRQRIAQIEETLLQQLSDALLYDEYPTLEYRFSSNFSQYFKQAASAFREEEQQQVTFARFVVKLADVWGVSRSEILPHMALITAIMSLKAVKPPELQVDRAVPVALWDNIPETVAIKPLIELPFGKGIADFQNAGFETLGETITAIHQNQLPVSERRNSYQRLKNILVNVADSLNDGDEETIWFRFANREHMTILPDREPDGPEDFLETVNEVIFKTICANSTFKHSAQIFELRTSQPKTQRPTLSTASKVIGTHAPTVKRTETEFVKMLNRQLIQKDFTESKVFFRKGFLGYWHHASNVYNATRQFARFKIDLEREWRLSPGALDEHADMIWTILNTYPNGRNVTRHRQKRVIRKDSETFNSTTFGVIRLRGFRRMH